MTRVLDKLERAGRRRAQHASESDFDALNRLLARLLDRQGSIFFGHLSDIADNRPALTGA
ncbi:hypothetical protein QFZ99_004647 [Paraburkholderia atlantica]|uniref:hypothetical protein n=1 Tax=Paraburkholderia atlantica TaxID=2654982 RepID=UPI003D25FF33